MDYQGFAALPLVALDVVHLDGVEPLHSVLRRSPTHRKDLPVEDCHCWEVATLPHGGEPAHLDLLLNPWKSNQEANLWVRRLEKPEVATELLSLRLAADQKHFSVQH